jgi:hypothetical protein
LKLLVHLGRVHLTLDDVEDRDVLAFEETKILLVWRRRRTPATVMGVYPVIRKWHLGVGISEANRPMRSLFMYPGYLRVVVLAHMMVDTI